jgi:hypothetical protein
MCLPAARLGLRMWPALLALLVLEAEVQVQAPAQDTVPTYSNMCQQ